VLVDEALIEVSGGHGGNGLISFRHEKYVPRGGPDGGDGGDGGDIYLVVDPAVHGLFDYFRLKKFHAEDGENGRKKKATGKSGEDLYLKVPPGTQVSEGDRVFADLTKSGETLQIAKGGKGGRGNYHFATSIRQAPRIAEPGKEGESRKLRLVLKLIAEVGIVGLPNVGKSTLLARISHARPKIANYPFTTLEPNLGVVVVDGTSQFVVADIPGLIEGAHQGRGLGVKFLRHIERTKLLWHMVDATGSDPIGDYKVVRKELGSFSRELPGKPEMVVLNKIDAIPPDQVKKIAGALKKATKAHIFGISGVSGKGITELVRATVKRL
jgi:GTP-binding protein